MNCSNRPQAMPKPLPVRKIGQHVATPWTQTEKYSERDYADFMID